MTHYFFILFSPNPPPSGSPRGRHLRAPPQPASLGPVDILSNPYPLAQVSEIAPPASLPRLPQPLCRPWVTPIKNAFSHLFPPPFSSLRNRPGPCRRRRSLRSPRRGGSAFFSLPAPHPPASTSCRSARASRPRQTSCPGHPGLFPYLPSCPFPQRKPPPGVGRGLVLPLGNVGRARSLWSARAPRRTGRLSRSSRPWSGWGHRGPC